MFSNLCVETRKLDAQDVFTDDGSDAASSGTVAKDDTIKEESGIADQVKKGGDEGAVKPDDVLHEAAVGKGLAGALRLLKDRGTLNEGGDKTTDKKKRKLVGSIKDGQKEIHIERIDEFGRVVSSKPTPVLPTYI
jgi:U4/U6.U5 tri-snRNP-associated protein 1